MGGCTRCGKYARGELDGWVAPRQDGVAELYYFVVLLDLAEILLGDVGRDIIPWRMQQGGMALSHDNLRSVLVLEYDFDALLESRASTKVIDL